MRRNRRHPPAPASVWQKDSMSSRQGIASSDDLPESGRKEDGELLLSGVRRSVALRIEQLALFDLRTFLTRPLAL